MSIQVPGRQQPNENPLIVLANAMRVIHQDLQSISERLAPKEIPVAVHAPGVGQLQVPGQWGVFCIGCTMADAGDDFVFPCQVVDTSDWPPQVLIEVPPSSEPQAG